ncbi:MAG: hypothetical protein CSA58_06140 [Micrococcales bacterium]|nr:MAG: hypothetical protein CSA58_06140 [Micrococcales bacterium]
MAKAFRRHQDGSLSIGLREIERSVLADLFGQVAAMLSAEAWEHGSPPAQETPAWARELGLSGLGMGGLGKSEIDQGPAGLRVGEQAGGPGPQSGSAPPRDPALARLLPDGRRDDPQAAAEFRRLTQAGVRDSKLAALVRAAECMTEGGRISPADAGQLVRALTDVRLVLAQRLGIENDDDADLTVQRAETTANEQEKHALLAYDFLGYVQESLTLVLAADLPPLGRPGAQPPTLEDL